MAAYVGRKLRVSTKGGDEFEGIMHSFDANSKKISLMKVSIVPSGKKLTGLLHFYGQEIRHIDFVEQPDSNAEEKQNPQRETQQKDNDLSETEDNSDLNLETAHDYIYLKHLGSKFRQAVELIKMQQLIGVAVEAEKRGRGAKVSLLQICCVNQVFIFDILSLGPTAFTQGVAEVLESPAAVKVMHDSRWASDQLYHQYSVKLANVYDTQAADVLIRMRQMNGELPHKLCSLPEILLEYLDMSMGEVYTQWVNEQARENEVGSGWLERPVRPKLLSLAAGKASHLPELRVVTLHRLLAEFTASVEVFLGCIRDMSDMSRSKAKVSPSVVPRQLERLVYGNLPSTNPPVSSHSTTPIGYGPLHKETPVHPQEKKENPQDKISSTEMSLPQTASTERTPSTTAPPPSTTAPPPSTTAPPPSTTAPPPFTTAPTPSTTVPPPSTTAPPPSTTAPPPSTTAPTPSTTVLPPSTTAPPPSTTAPPPSTTAPPQSPTSSAVHFCVPKTTASKEVSPPERLTNGFAPSKDDRAPSIKRSHPRRPSGKRQCAPVFSPTKADADEEGGKNVSAEKGESGEGFWDLLADDERDPAASRALEVTSPVAAAAKLPELKVAVPENQGREVCHHDDVDDSELDDSGGNDSNNDIDFNDDDASDDTSDDLDNIDKQICLGKMSDLSQEARSSPSRHTETIQRLLRLSPTRKQTLATPESTGRKVTTRNKGSTLASSSAGDGPSPDPPSRATSGAGRLYSAVLKDSRLPKTENGCSDVLNVQSPTQFPDLDRDSQGKPRKHHSRQGQDQPSSGRETGYSSNSLVAKTGEITRDGVPERTERPQRNPGAVPKATSTYGTHPEQNVDAFPCTGAGFVGSAMQPLAERPTRTSVGRGRARVLAQSEDILRSIRRPVVHDLQTRSSRVQQFDFPSKEEMAKLPRSLPTRASDFYRGAQALNSS